MTCCAVGPCERYLGAQESIREEPIFRDRRQRDFILWRACALCWWGEQKQPETLIGRRDRQSRETEARECAKALGLKPGKETMPEEEHYGQAQLRPRKKVLPFTHPSHRDGPMRVSPSASVSPPLKEK